MTTPMRLGAVIITMGNRPDELKALLDSVARQDGAPVEVVVVGQGVKVTGLPEEVRTVDLPENLGIPGGRNVGIEAFGPGGTDVDALLFLDDDGLLERTDTAELCRQAFAEDPRSGSSASGSPIRTPARPSGATCRGCAPPTPCGPPA